LATGTAISTKAIRRRAALPTITPEANALRLVAGGWWLVAGTYWDALTITITRR